MFSGDSCDCSGTHDSLKQTLASQIFLVILRLAYMPLYRSLAVELLDRALSNIVSMGTLVRRPCRLPMSLFLFETLPFGELFQSDRVNKKAQSSTISYIHHCRCWDHCQRPTRGNSVNKIGNL